MDVLFLKDLEPNEIDEIDNNFKNAMFKIIINYDDSIIEKSTKCIIIKSINNLGYAFILKFDGMSNLKTYSENEWMKTTIVLAKTVMNNIYRNFLIKHKKQGIIEKFFPIFK